MKSLSSQRCSRWLLILDLAASGSAGSLAGEPSRTEPQDRDGTPPLGLKSAGPPSALPANARVAAAGSGVTPPAGPVAAPTRPQVGEDRRGVAWLLRNQNSNGGGPPE
jgi:hypothetical protein